MSAIRTVDTESGELVSLSHDEREHLEVCETIIRAGMQTFVEVGHALSDVRDRRLYRASHDTFERYCEDRWGLSDRRARQMIDAAGVADGMGETGTMVPVGNERQARELGRLPEDQRPGAWEAAVAAAAAEGVALAARHVADVVASLLPETEEQKRDRLVAACVQAIAADPEADNVTIAARVGCSVVKVRAARQRIAKTAGAGVGPTPSPAAGDGGAPPVPSAPPAEDEDDATSSDSGSAGGPSNPPADPYPELTYVTNAHKAMARMWDDLALLDPARLAAAAPESRGDVLALADHLHSKADEIRAAFARPHLEAVR